MELDHDQKIKRLEEEIEAQKKLNKIASLEKELEDLKNGNKTQDDYYKWFEKNIDKNRSPVPLPYFPNTTPLPGPYSPNYIGDRPFINKQQAFNALFHNDCR